MQKRKIWIQIINQQSIISQGEQHLQEQRFDHPNHDAFIIHWNVVVEVIIVQKNIEKRGRIQYTMEENGCIN